MMNIEPGTKVRSASGDEWDFGIVREVNAQTYTVAVDPGVPGTQPALFFAPLEDVVLDESPTLSLQPAPHLPPSKSRPEAGATPSTLEPQPSHDAAGFTDLETIALGDDNVPEVPPTVDLSSSSPSSASKDHSAPSLAAALGEVGEPAPVAYVSKRSGAHFAAKTYHTDPHCGHAGGDEVLPLDASTLEFLDLTLCKFCEKRQNRLAPAEVIADAIRGSWDRQHRVTGQASPAKLADDILEALRESGFRVSPESVDRPDSSLASTSTSTDVSSPTPSTDDSAEAEPTPTLLELSQSERR